jgi:hypothetical protein
MLRRSFFRQSRYFGMPCGCGAAATPQITIDVTGV